MKILAGLPTLIAVGGLLYIVAESGSRWLALVVSAGLFCVLLASLRAEVSVQPAAEEAGKLREEREPSDSQ